MKSILLVEDDPFLIDIYSQKLGNSGFEVAVVKEGDKVFEALQKKKPDLMLLDIVLPGVEGWEILRRIGKDDSFSNLKVVILSNLGQKEEVEKGLKLGALRYLIKANYTPTEVVEEIKKILK